ncbi:DUF1353 domain-containing protein [Paraburkholderia caledonica]|uniref:DUF1353 domain-containing protein n=1 Tax=Paraburkholderia caledonica TaxID=134536 RepID=UPI0038BD7C23
MRRLSNACVRTARAVRALGIGYGTRPASCTDFLCSTRPVTSAIADAVLREASAVTSVPAWRRAIIWAAVRVRQLALGVQAYCRMKHSLQRISLVSQVPSWNVTRNGFIGARG